MTGVKSLDAMCESCGADITQYSIICDECWNEIEERHSGKIAELKNELSDLKSRLQKYETGMDPEEAKDGNYYSAKAKAFPDPIIIYWNDLMQAWSFSAAQFPLSDDDFEGPFHPIAPTLEAQSGEVIATDGDHQSRAFPLPPLKGEEE